MSKQWSQVSSVTEEPKLFEVMSEELCKQLQMEEDFVWVDMPDALHESARKCKTNNSFGPHIINVVQSRPTRPRYDRFTSDWEFSEESECDTSKRDPVLDVELYDSEYEELCIKNVGNLLKPLKIKYPTPRWLKTREHSLYTNEKTQRNNKQKNKNCDMHNNDFLPAMKFDESTTEVLKMLVKNRYLGHYNGLVGTGKNTFVFHALCSRNNCITMPLNNAVKIYKTSKCEQRNRIIYRRVQREFENLSALRRCRAICDQSPWPVKAKDNVIVMLFIGIDDKVAQSIAALPYDKDQTVYNGVIAYLDRCYNLGYLVHGNLSASKILWRFETPQFVGWSHSVKRGHPQALKKLMKDCHFVTEFYKRRGLFVRSAVDIFKQITMQEKPSDKLLAIIQDKDLYEKYETNPNRKEKNSVKPTNNRFK